VGDKNSSKLPEFHVNIKLPSVFLNCSIFSFILPRIIDHFLRFRVLGMVNTSHQTLILDTPSYDKQFLYTSGYGFLPGLICEKRAYITTSFCLSLKRWRPTRQNPRVFRLKCGFYRFWLITRNEVKIEYPLERSIFQGIFVNYRVICTRTTVRSMAPTGICNLHYRA